MWRGGTNGGVREEGGKEEGRKKGRHEEGRKGRREKKTYPNGLPSRSIVFSFDVCNLYGSIPIQVGIDAVMNLIKTNLNKINMFGITIDDLRSLLTHVLTNNYVRFNSKIFKQTTGIAMGNRLAPPVAIAFMHYF